MIKNVIISALITEKSMKDAALGKFTFKVSKESNKFDIKKAVEQNFSVDVVSVSTGIQKGKSIRVGKRREEKKISSWKKATVGVKKGQKIGLFELGDK